VETRDLLSWRRIVEKSLRQRPAAIWQMTTVLAWIADLSDNKRTHPKSDGNQMPQKPMIEDFPTLAQMRRLPA